MLRPEDELGKGGPKERFRQNLEAIRLLKRLEQESRRATPEEQAVLAGYVGWDLHPFDPVRGY